MARKPTSSSSESKKPAARSAATKKPASITTEVRNTPIPKVSAAISAKKEITHEMIAKRAFEISMGPTCGSELDNWHRAERELKGL